MLHALTWGASAGSRCPVGESPLDAQKWLQYGGLEVWHPGCHRNLQHWPKQEHLSSTRCEVSHTIWALRAGHPTLCTPCSTITLVSEGVPGEVEHSSE